MSKGKSEEQTKRSPEVDVYIGQFPQAVQTIMTRTRELIHEAVPECTEKISWAMPTFQWQGRNLCHFAGHKEHLGFYPGPAAIVAHKAALAPYKTSKGAIQFRYDQEIPYELIDQIVGTARAALVALEQERQQSKGSGKPKDLG